MALEDEFLEIRFNEVDRVCGKVRFSVRIRGDTTWMFIDNLIVHAGDTFTMSDSADECDPRVVALNRETWTEALRNTKSEEV